LKTDRKRKIALSQHIQRQPNYPLPMSTLADAAPLLSFLNSEASDLVIFLSLGGLGCQEPAIGSVLVLLVGDGDLVQVSEDVLHLGVSVAALVTSEVVEPCPFVEEVVDDGNDDGDTDRVTPDNDNGDNAGVSVVREKAIVVSGIGLLSSTSSEPAENTEEGSKDIDTEDGADELPGRPGVASTGDEDEPVFSEGDFEEENALDTTEVVDDTSVR